jgi:hypothetical protein
MKDMKENISTGIAVLAIVISIVAIASTVVIGPVSTIGASSVGENELKDNSVTGDKVADGALTDADISNIGISKIADDAIAGDQIASDSITLLHFSPEVISAMTGETNITAVIEDDSITSAKIADGTITDDDIIDSGISKIADNVITGGKIASSSITLAHLTSAVIDAMTGVSDIADNSITSAKITDGTIANVDISDSADIVPSKILGTAWTATNDGSGSGLDADTVDGVHATDLMSKSVYDSDGDNIVDNAADTDTVDGLDASAFIKKAGDTMSGSLVLNADPTANLGAATKQYVDDRAGASASAFIQSYTVTDTASTILQATVTAPSDGYVIAYTTGELQGNRGSSWAAARIFLTDNPTATTSTMQTRAYLNSNTVGTFEFPFSVVGHFTATEGSNTIYVRGRSEGAGTLDDVYSVNLVLMFVPN